MTKAKVKKIMLFPSRTLQTAGGGYAKLSAGIELEFETPVALDSKELKEGFAEARAVVVEELRKQYEPYKVTNKKKKG